MTGWMKVLESVPGEVLVLEVGSRSGKFGQHTVVVTYARDGSVASTTCTCPGWNYRGICHHVGSIKDLVGLGIKREEKED